MTAKTTTPLFPPSQQRCLLRVRHGVRHGRVLLSSLPADEKGSVMGNPLRNARMYTAPQAAQDKSSHFSFSGGKEHPLTQPPPQKKATTQHKAPNLCHNPYHLYPDQNISPSPPSLPPSPPIPSLPLPHFQTNTPLESLKPVRFHTHTHTHTHNTHVLVTTRAFTHSSAAGCKGFYKKETQKQKQK